MPGETLFGTDLNRRVQGAPEKSLDPYYYSASPQPTVSPTGFSVLIVRAVGSPSKQPMNKDTKAPSAKPERTESPTHKPMKTQAPMTRPPTGAPTTRPPTASPTTKSPTAAPTKLPTSSPTDPFNLTTSGGPTFASEKRIGNGATTANQHVSANVSLFWIFCIAALSMLVVLSIGLLIFQMKKRRQQPKEENSQPISSPPPIIITCKSDDNSEQVTMTLQDENVFSKNKSSHNMYDEYSVDEFTYQNTEKGDDDQQSIAFSMDAQSGM
jgi:hypothetical protein